MLKRSDEDDKRMNLMFCVKGCFSRYRCSIWRFREGWAGVIEYPGWCTIWVQFIDWAMKVVYRRGLGSGAVGRD